MSCLLVNYCVFQHIFMKPTLLWTTLVDLQLKGCTGDGRCRNASHCQAGNMVKGEWQHTYVIAGDAKRRYPGSDLEEQKNKVPKLLLKEVLEEALRVTHF